jgi:hypothetical protein
MRCSSSRTPAQAGRHYRTYSARCTRWTPRRRHQSGGAGRSKMRSCGPASTGCCTVVTRLVPAAALDSALYGVAMVGYSSGYRVRVWRVARVIGTSLSIRTGLHILGLGYDRWGEVCRAHPHSSSPRIAVVPYSLEFVKGQALSRPSSHSPSHHHFVHHHFYPTYHSPSS